MPIADQPATPPTNTPPAGGNPHAASVDASPSQLVPSLPPPAAAAAGGPAGPAAPLPSASLVSRESTSLPQGGLTETTPPDDDKDPSATAFPADMDECQTFRHSGWRLTRNRIYRALVRTEQSASRIRAFCGCGKNAWVWVSEAGETIDYRVTCDWCHDRFCEPCGTARSFAAAEKLVNLAEGKSVRFLTLTLRGSPGKPLAPLLKRLSESFAELRETAFWKGCVDGGAAFLELKHKHHWHPHLHVIAEGRYIDQRRLSALWHGITGDSFMVDVRAIDGRGDRLKYAAKYASKPLDMSFIKRPKLLDEAISALFGKRMIQPFGSWYGKISDDDKLEGLEGKLGGQSIWRQVGTLPDIFRRALGGEIRMIEICELLRRKPVAPANPQPPPIEDSVTNCDVNSLFHQRDA